MKKTIVIFAAFALVFGFAATTMAADWDFYGSARFATFYTTSDQGSPTNPAGLNDDYSSTQWALQGNSRIGATVSNGDVGGGFEYGSGPNLRKLYGTWNFGAGELLVGQTYTPTVQFYSNQVFASDNDLLGVGQFYNGRQPMIQLKMGGFKVALVTPVTDFDDRGGVEAATEVTIPKIELAYKFSTDMFFVEPMAGYQTYDILNADGDGESVDSYVFGAYAGVMFGPASVYFGGYYAENTGAYGAFQGYGSGTLFEGNPVWDGSELQDNEEYGGILVVNFKINDMLSAEGGIGYKSNEIDSSSVGGKWETEVMSYYVNLPIQLADGVFITPEIGYFDFGDYKRPASAGGDVDQESDTYFGAKWQINF